MPCWGLRTPQRNLLGSNYLTADLNCQLPASRIEMSRRFVYTALAAGLFRDDGFCRQLVTVVHSVLFGRLVPTI